MTAIVETRPLPAMKVLGLSRNFFGMMAPTSNGHEVIPELWGQLFDTLDDFEEFEFGWAVGLMSPVFGPDAKPGEMQYFAGLVVEAEPESHPGLTMREVEAGQYAICEHIGTLEDLGETTAWFYGEYLPSSNLAEREAYHLEVYDERFDPESDHSVVMICAPIQA
ncbi:MAG: hypothetical protein RL508_1116 [Actinomycetota bacterium]|jgi:predicted transcriptional regulator YdeE